MPLKSFDFYSLGHAARVLDVSHSSLYKKARSGEIRTRRASDGSWLFDHKEIEKEKLKASKRTTGRRFIESPSI